MTSPIAHCIARIALILCVFGPLTASHAAEGPDNRPLDVVLVMDSSGSMKWTDPRELRKPAAKLLISLLGDKDRASVVSFSDQGYPVAFFTPVKGQQNEARLFAAVDKISNKGVYTNLLGAVEGAMRVINRNPLPDRKTIVVLMTDGKMDLGDAATNQSKSETLMQDFIPKLKRQNIELHTIAFTDESDKAYLEQLAQATGGKFNLAQTDKQLHDVYTSIFEQNKQPNMLPFDGEKFSIDSAIKEVTIVGSKDSADAQLSLQTPTGAVISAANKPADIKWFTAEAFDLITIQNPKPGQWQIKSSSGKNKAYIITDLNFQLQVEPQEVAIGEGLMINAWLEDGGVKIDKPSILSTLKMALRVHTPEGATHDLDMQAQVKEDGSNQPSGVYLNHIALPSAGSYKIEVLAEGSTFSRVRNSVVNVFDPASMPKESAPVPQDISPAMPEMNAPSHSPAMTEPELHTAAAVEEPMETPEPHSEPAPAVEPPAAESHAVEQHHEAPAETHAAASHHETPADAHSEPPQAQGQHHKPETPAAEAEHKPANESTQDKSHEESKAEHSDEPNMLKALGIFLLINGVFAVLGGAGFLIYRMKKNKSAKKAKDDGDEADDKAAGEAKKRAA